MNNPDILKEVFSFAYQYMSAKEISVITGVDLVDLKDEDSAAHKEFQKGRLLRKAEFHASVIQLSKQLSSPAMTIEQKIAEQVHINDLKK